MNRPSTHQLPILVCLALLLLTLVSYWGVWTYGFTNLDDNAYVVENTTVHGLTWEHVRSAVTTFRSSYWAPLLWISFMVDYELWGLDPAGFHLANVLLHAAAVVLLFLVLRRATGALWPSAATAAIFAAHPVHVEAVAWIAERKELLASVFWMTSLGAYLHYTRRPSWRRYLLVLAAMALGLMSKPTLVTLPAVLLLLDGWPLGRLRSRRDLPRLLLEKVPLAALSLGSSVMTSMAARDAILPVSVLGVESRLANALVSYLHYLRMFFWPVDLAAFYPLSPEPPQAALALAAGLALAGVTAIAWSVRRSLPHLLVGWLWFLVTLVPVLGLVQVGDQARADRFLHVPSIGLSIALAWTVRALVERAAVRPAVIGVSAALAMLALAAATRLQSSYWRSGISLYQRTIAVTGGAFLPHYTLAKSLAVEGRFAEAQSHFEAALRFSPRNADAHADLGLCLVRMKRPAEAHAALTRALALDPEHAGAHQSLGIVAAAAGSLDDAERHFRTALALDPALEHGHYNLALVLHRSGRDQEAAHVLEDGLRLGKRDGQTQRLLAALRRRPQYENGQTLK